MANRYPLLELNSIVSDSTALAAWKKASLNQMLAQTRLLQSGHRYSRKIETLLQTIYLTILNLVKNFKYIWKN